MHKGSLSTCCKVHVTLTLHSVESDGYHKNKKKNNVQKLTHFAQRATIVAGVQSSRSSKGRFSGRDRIENELMSLFSFYF